VGVWRQARPRRRSPPTRPGGAGTVPPVGLAEHADILEPLFYATVPTRAISGPSRGSRWMRRPCSIRSSFSRPDPDWVTADQRHRSTRPPTEMQRKAEEKKSKRPARRRANRAARPAARLEDIGAGATMPRAVRPPPAPYRPPGGRGGAFPPKATTWLGPGLGGGGAGAVAPATSAAGDRLSPGEFDAHDPK